MKNLFRAVGIGGRDAAVTNQGSLHSKLQRIKTAWMLLLILIIGFSMAACNDSPKDDGLPSETKFSVKGQFDNKKFSLADAKNYKRNAVSADSYAIEGELEDGDIIFRLKGTYDPVARNYTASAASSIIRFSISGAFNDKGVSLGSTATVLTKDGDDWIAFSYVVTESNAVTFTATKTAPEYDGGIPEWARGWWRYSGLGFSSKVLFSQWAFMEEFSFVDNGKTVTQTFSASIIEAENKGAYWDIIAGFPVYIGSQTQVEAAAAAFLTSKGLTGTKLAKDPYSAFPNGYYYYVQITGAGEYSFLNFGGNFPGSNENGLGEMYDGITTYMANNPSTFTADAAGKTALENYIAGVFSSAGLTATKLNEMPMPDYSGASVGIIYWYEDDDIRWDYYFGDSEWNEALMNKLAEYQEEWWNTNYLEKYLIGLGVKESTRYSKIRAAFSNNNTRMTASNYYTGTPENEVMEWDSVAAAKAATDVYVNPDSPDITLTR